MSEPTVSKTGNNPFYVKARKKPYQRTHSFPLPRSQPTQSHDPDRYLPRSPNSLPRMESDSVAYLCWFLESVFLFNPNDTFKGLKDRIMCQVKMAQKEAFVECRRSRSNTFGNYLPTARQTPSHPYPHPSLTTSPTLSNNSFTFTSSAASVGLRKHTINPPRTVRTSLASGARNS